jgi:hypothetical protein
MLPRRNRSIWSMVFHTCLIAQTSPTATADEPSPRQLIELAPVISSSDKNYRSIELGGYLRQKGVSGLTFRASYRAPDHYAVLIKDKADGTPLFFAMDRQMFLYDPVRSIVLWNADSNVRFSLVQEGDALKIHLGATTDRDEPSNVLLEVKSLLASPFINEKVVELGAKKYRLTRTTEKGNSLDFGIDLGCKQPYTNITITLKGSTEPCASINEIKVNSDLNEEQARFPKRDELAEKISVQDLPGCALARDGSGLTLLMRACYARAAISQPAMREAFNLAANSAIEWNRVKESDQKVSHVLREALSTAPRPK